MKTHFDHAKLDCMLAEHIEEVPEHGYPFVSQPKFDGFRMLFHAYDKAEDFRVFTRARPGVAGNSDPYQANLRHVGLALHAIGFRNCLVDGEITASSWNELAKLVRLKKPTPEQQQLIAERCQLVVFDLVRHDELEAHETTRGKKLVAARVSYKRRRQDLELMLDREGLVHHGCVWLAPERVVTSKEEAQEAHEHWCLAHEGSMLKQPHSMYVFDRSAQWLAWKPYETFEAEVVGYVAGEGKLAGKMGALQVRSLRDGVEFNVGTGFSHVAGNGKVDERGDEPMSYIGRVMEVRVQKCDVATARHPSFIRWRVDQEA